MCVLCLLFHHTATLGSTQLLQYYLLLWNARISALSTKYYRRVKLHFEDHVTANPV